MTTDRELLEKAAKAAGMRIEWIGDVAYDCTKLKSGKPAFKGSMWSPLFDDGDALRLAVKLKLSVMVDFDRVDVTQSIAEPEAEATEYLYEFPSPTDPYAATRRAIVRAAAAIGEQMP